MHYSILPWYMASGAFPRRSAGTSARYWENVKRFPGFYSESIFSSDYNGLKIHRHLLLFRCFTLYFLQWTTLSELCKNYTTTPVLVQCYKGFRRGNNVISSGHRFVSSNKASGFVLTQEHCQDVCLPYVIWKKIKKIELRRVILTALSMLEITNYTSRQIELADQKLAANYNQNTNERPETKVNIDGATN